MAGFFQAVSKSIKGTLNALLFSENARDEQTLKVRQSWNTLNKRHLENLRNRVGNRVKLFTMDFSGVLNCYCTPTMR